MQSRNPITDPYEVEERLARELQRRKVEEEKKRREIERICAESEEIKQLKQKVQTAYITKERTQQIAETQLRRMNELKQDCELEAAILRKRQLEEEEERYKEQCKLKQRLDGKYTLQKQMIEHHQLREEAKEQYNIEKGQVNNVVTRLIEEDLRSMEDNERKKKIAFADMQQALQDKYELKRQQKMHEYEENQKYLQFMKDKDRQAEQIKFKKSEENAAKDKIFQKLKEEEDRRKYEQDLLTELRFQLYQEQYDALQKQKEQDEQDKRARQKREMQQAEKEARDKKIRQKEEELRMEQSFKQQMLQKFALDDKLEQLGQQKRRMKEVEHKKEVERMWVQKLEMYQQEKLKEQEAVEKLRQEQEFKRAVIEEEKNKLLMEHLQQVGEFIPKGMLLKANDTGFIKQGKQNSSYQSGFRLQ